MEGRAAAGGPLTVCMMSCDSSFRTEDRGTGTYLFIPLGLSRPEALLMILFSIPRGSFLMGDKAALVHYYNRGESRRASWARHRDIDSLLSRSTRYQLEPKAMFAASARQLPSLARTRPIDPSSSWTPTT